METLLEQWGFLNQPKESETPDATTYNGNPSFESIGTPHLDFYAGVTRQTLDEDIIKLAEDCFNDNMRLAVVTFFQKRNCRGGAGERKPFILAMKTIPQDLRHELYSLVPIYGYWKDLLEIASAIPDDQEYIAGLMAKQLLANMMALKIPNIKVDINLEKWLPSKNGKHDKEWKAVSKIISSFNDLVESTDEIFCPKETVVRQLQFELTKHVRKIDSSAEIRLADNKFVVHFDYDHDERWEKAQDLVNRYNHILDKGRRVMVIQTMTCVSYRKWCSYQRARHEVIEHYTSTDNWELIDYSHVPSIAFDRSKNQFHTHDGDRFSQFIERVKDGEIKINVSRVMPFELVSQGRNSDVINEQWKLVVEETKSFYSDVDDQSPLHPKNTVHVCDVSNSMTTDFYGARPIDVSRSMGILMSEVGQRDFYTFSGEPKRYSPDWKTLDEALTKVRDNNFNTDLRKLIDMIHDDCMLEADQKNVSPSETIPGSIVIYTDGGFDQMCKMAPTSALEYLQGKFGQYRKVPIFIFWNVAGNTKDFQVKQSVKGVIQLSGFSKDLYQSFTQITDPEEISPESFFRKDVLSEVYQPVLKVYDEYIQLSIDDFHQT